MKLKKDFPALLLSAILSMGYVSGYQSPQHKFRFSLSRYETPYFNHLQKHRKAFEREREYRIFKAPGDNMPIFAPDESKYPMPIIKPGPEWYRNDKFVIKPGPEWMLPRDWMKKELYKNPAGKLPLGALLYHWEHK
jgi:hypothetical protein